MAYRDPQQARDYRKRYYAKNRIQILEKQKPYNLTQKRKDRAKNYNREYRLQNLAHIATVRRAAQRIRADEFLALKQEIGCRLCGYRAHGAALDFHHLNPKEKVCQVLSSNYKSAKGRAEIKKCALLCANCHRIETISQKRSSKQ